MLNDPLNKSISEKFRIEVDNILLGFISRATGRAHSSNPRPNDLIAFQIAHEILDNLLVTPTTYGSESKRRGKNN